MPLGEGNDSQRGDLIEELRERANELRDATKEGRFSFNEPSPKDPGTTPPLLGRAEALAARLIALQGDPDTKRRMADDGPVGRSYQLEYFRACCWTAEVLEYFGETNRVREIVENEGRLISGALLNIPCGTLDERKRARQMLWMVFHYLYCCLYRRHDYHKALRVIDT